MLSIGRMAYGQEEYYLRLTRYYQELREPEGTWWGAGAEKLGLGATVSDEQLRALMRGYTPGGRPLVKNAGHEDRDPGWDATFSRPKSVSILGELSPEWLRDQIDAADWAGVQKGLEYITEEAELEEKLNVEHLKSQIDQIQLARAITRISPASVVQYALESLAGTGFQRHLQFLEQVRRYAREFREFLIASDKADPESPHAPFLKEGMSEKPVSFEAIPKFADEIAFSDSLNTALMGL